MGRNVLVPPSFDCVLGFSWLGVLALRGTTSLDPLKTYGTQVGNLSQPQIERRNPMTAPKATEIVVQEDLAETLETSVLEDELFQMSDRLSRMFEELALIHDLSRQVHIAKSAREHCVDALGKLAECLQVETLVAIIDIDDPCGERTDGRRDVVQVGKTVCEALALRISEEIGEKSPQVINYRLRCAPLLDRIATVQLEEKNPRSGRLLAISSSPREELGTPEVQMMQSIASILRAHLAIHKQFAQMREMFEGTVRALVSAIDAKDPYTCGHSSRVAELSSLLAEELGFSTEDVETVRMSGLLHDIGKIGVADAVLRKPGKLTEEEFAEIKKHPELGYRILQGIPQFHAILPGVRFHHESMDGRGYPMGLVGEEIPMIARIIAVADAFDAMTSTRTYRAGQPLERVVEIFKQGAGQQWDAKIVDLLLGDESRMRRIMSRSS